MPGVYGDILNVYPCFFYDKIFARLSVKAFFDGSRLTPSATSQETHTFPWLILLLVLAFPSYPYLRFAVGFTVCHKIIPSGIKWFHLLGVWTHITSTLTILFSHWQCKIHPWYFSGIFIIYKFNERTEILIINCLKSIITK